MPISVAGVVGDGIEVGEETDGTAVGGAPQLASITSNTPVVRRRTAMLPPLITSQRLDAEGDLIV